MSRGSLIPAILFIGSCISIVGVACLFFIPGSFGQMPLWVWFVFLLLPVIVVGIMTIVGIKLQGSDAEPHCPHCGYNLTGNTSGVCPECGREIPAAPNPTER